MQLIKILIFLLFFGFLGCGLAYVLLPYEVLGVFYIVFALFYLVIILFADKILMAMLGARESVESTNSLFFQKVKNISFQLGVKTPRVFSYRGNVSRIFALKSRNEISLVFESRILSTLNINEQEALIAYMLLSEKVGGARRRAFVYLMSSFLISFLYSTKSRLQRWIKNVYIVNSIVFILATIVRPFIEEMFSMAFTKKEKGKVQLLLDIHLKDLEYLKSALTKISYRSFNQDLLEKTVLNFLITQEAKADREKFIDIFEVFPSLESELN